MDAPHTPPGGPPTPGVFSTAAAVARRIAGFTPATGTPDWDRLGPQVRAVVTAARPCTPTQAGEFLSVLAQLAVFADAHGHPVSGPGWLTPGLVAAFATEGRPQVGQATLAGYLSKLRRLARAVGAGEDTPGLTLQATDVFRPYTTAQLSAWWTHAGAHRVERARRDAHVLLALAAGCGLTGPEIAQARAHDLRVTDAGVVVAARGPAARLVVARRPYEQFLAHLAAEHAGQVVYLLRPDVFGRDPRLVVRVAAALRPTPQAPPVTLRRLRASWLVALLEAGVALPVVVAAAGLDDPARLARLLPHLRPAPAGQCAQALRGGT